MWQNRQAGCHPRGHQPGSTPIRAPFDGVVTQHLVSIGGLVGRNGATPSSRRSFELNPIYVTFNVSEQGVLLLIRADRDGGPDHAGGNR